MVLLQLKRPAGNGRWSHRQDRLSDSRHYDTLRCPVSDYRTASYFRRFWSPNGFYSPCPASARHFPQRPFVRNCSALMRAAQEEPVNNLILLAFFCAASSTRPKVGQVLRTHSSGSPTSAPNPFQHHPRSTPPVPAFHSAAATRRLCPYLFRDGVVPKVRDLSGKVASPLVLGVYGALAHRASGNSSLTNFAQCRSETAGLEFCRKSLCCAGLPHGKN